MQSTNDLAQIASRLGHASTAGRRFEPLAEFEARRLVGLRRKRDHAPARGAQERLDHLSAEWVVLRERLENVMNTLVAEFNAMLRRQNVAPIIWEP